MGSAAVGLTVTIDDCKEYIVRGRSYATVLGSSGNSINNGPGSWVNGSSFAIGDGNALGAYSAYTSAVLDASNNSGDSDNGNCVIMGPHYIVESTQFVPVTELSGVRLPPGGSFEVSAVHSVLGMQLSPCDAFNLVSIKIGNYNTVKTRSLHSAVTTGSSYKSRSLNSLCKLQNTKGKIGDSNLLRDSSGVSTAVSSSSTEDNQQSGGAQHNA
jgi:hypothetical protein